MPNSTLPLPQFWGALWVAGNTRLTGLFRNYVFFLICCTILWVCSSTYATVDDTHRYGVFVGNHKNWLMMIGKLVVCLVIVSFGESNAARKLREYCWETCPLGFNSRFVRCRCDMRKRKFFSCLSYVETAHCIWV